MKLTDLKLFSPEIFLIFGAIFILLFGIFYKKNEEVNKKILFITIGSLLLSIYSLIYFVDINTSSFNDFLNNNLYTFFFKFIILFGSLVIVCISYNYLKDLDLITPEFFFLILFSLVGILILISSKNIISMYLGLELQSICLYVLAAYKKTDLRSSESGIKYFVMGAFSSAILL